MVVLVEALQHILAGMVYTILKPRTTGFLISYLMAHCRTHPFPLLKLVISMHSSERGDTGFDRSRLRYIKFLL